MAASRELGNGTVYSIYVQSRVPGDAATIASELLTMQGVNYELMPITRMTAPRVWRETPIPEWPVQEHLFDSVLLLFGILPFDRHRFGLLETGPSGFSESSSSLFMKAWRHDRVIEDQGGVVRVTDSVQFEPRVKLLGALVSPIYETVFRHRHKRLTRKFGVP